MKWNQVDNSKDVERRKKWMKIQVEKVYRGAKEMN